MSSPARVVASLVLLASCVAGNAPAAPKPPNLVSNAEQRSPGGAREAVDANTSAARASLAKALGGRRHAPSRATKGAFFGVHALGVAGALLMLKHLPSMGLVNRAPARSVMCASVTVLYLVRHAITLFYLLQRQVLAAEAIPLAAFMAAWALSSVVLSTGCVWPHWTGGPAVNYVGLSLALVGSLINTTSEIQRKWWKADPLNAGHCYTRGLWRYAVHVNYFGDLLLFSGWVLLTGSPWVAWLPATMAANFALVQGPELDDYLRRRYGAEFADWEARTKQLIPFIW